MPFLDCTFVCVFVIFAGINTNLELFLGELFDEFLGVPFGFKIKFVHITIVLVLNASDFRRISVFNNIDIYIFDVLLILAHVRYNI